MHNNFHYLTIIQNSWHILPSSWTIFVFCVCSLFHFCYSAGFSYILIHFAIILDNFCFLSLFIVSFLLQCWIFLYSHFFMISIIVYIYLWFFYTAVRTGCSPGWFTAVIPCLGLTDLNTLYSFLNTLSSFLIYTLIFLMAFFYNKETAGGLGILQKFHVW